MNRLLKHQRDKRYRTKRQQQLEILEEAIYETAKYVQDVMYAQVQLTKQLTHYKQLYYAAQKKAEELEKQILCKRKENNGQ